MDIEDVSSTRLNNLSLVTFILFWSGLVILSSLYVTIPLLPVFASIYDISSSQAAWAGSIFSIAFAISCLVFGPVSDQYGRKKVMVLGLLSLTIMTCTIGLANNFSQLLVLRALQGVTAATFSPVALTYVAEMFPQKKRVTTIGFISSGFLMAGIVGQLISSVIEPLMNWNMVFYFLSSVYGVTTILLVVILPKDIIERKRKGIFTVIQQFKVPFKQKTVILCYGIAITILLAFVGMYTSLGHYLTTSFHFDAQHIFYVRAAGIVGILLSPLTGRFIDTFGMHKVLNSGLFCSIFSLFCMGFSTNLFIIIVMSIIFVSGIAIVVPAMLALVGQLGGEDRGIVTAIYIFILFTGASMGPILATFILKTGNTALSFFVLGSILTVSLVISVCIHFLSKTQNRNSKDKGNSDERQVK